MSAPNELTFGNRIGIFLLVEISAVSASAITILLAYIAVRFSPDLVFDSNRC